MRNYKRLKGWQKAHRFVLDVYAETRDFPAEERFGLTRQVRRSAASIPANIAEGAGRSSDVDFARFVDFAIGSANETEYHLLLALDLGFLGSSAHVRLVDQLQETRKMITALRQTLRRETATANSP